MTGRRAVLAGLPAAGVMAALPALASPEVPSGRVHRLMRELSFALDDALDGGFRAIVEPSGADGSTMWLQNMRVAREGAQLRRFLATACDHDLAGYHAMEATCARQRMKGGAWQVTVDSAHDFMVATGGWPYPEGVCRRYV